MEKKRNAKSQMTCSRCVESFLIESAEPQGQLADRSDESACSESKELHVGGTPSTID